MKSLSRAALSITLLISMSLFVGCGSKSQQSSSDNQSGMSGGNGSMGENPAHPGSYSGDQSSTPSGQPSGR